MFGKITVWFVTVWLGFGAAFAAAPAPAPSLFDLKHVSWTVEQGAPTTIQAIVQSPDGFLWLGTPSGLYRFDGVKFDHVPIPFESGLHGQDIMALRVLASGDLLVGFDQGQTGLFAHGRWTKFANPLPPNPVRDLAEDQEGGIWVAHVGAGSGLARFFHGHWQQFGPESGLPLDWVWNVSVLPDGTILVRSRSGPFVRKPGSPRFESLPAGTGKSPLVVTDQQRTVWRISQEGAKILTRAGEDAPMATLIPLPLQATPHSALVARDGGIWITTYATGLIRLRPSEPAPVETMTRAQGLTSDLAISSFQDREGNVWIGTVNGLDQFRRESIVAEPSVPTALNGLMISRGAAGSVLVTDFNKLYPFPPRTTAASLPTPPDGFEVECAGPGDTIMIGTTYGFWQVAGGRLVPLPSPPPPAPPAQKRHLFQCMTDGQGRTWFTAMSDGAIMFDHGRWTHYALPRGRGDNWAKNIAIDADGMPLIYLENGPLLQFGPTGSRGIWEDRAGVMGEVQAIFVGSQELLLGSASGLTRVREGRASNLVKPWLQLTVGIARVGSDTWLLTGQGLVRIRTSDLDAAFDHPERDPPHRLFDYRDGMPGPIDPFGKSNLLLARDGRLWFITSDRLAYLDPAAIPSNPFRPAVVITGITADGRPLGGAESFHLPSGAHDLHVEFTATSLSVPSRVRFRYRLVGLDPTWKDIGTGREVDFPHLGPGDYEIEVVASNDDGVWSDRAATRHFSIAPAFYQTRWFAILVCLAIAMLAYGAALLVERQKRVRERSVLKGQLAERERIARELHDTLLQGVQALILSVHGVATRLPAGHPERPVIGDAVERAEIIAEQGRDSVHNLRTAATGIPLRETLEQLGRRLLSTGTELDVATVGREQPLDEEVEDEIRKIASEAFVNVAKHAQARRVHLRLEYAPAGFSMRIADDGLGLAGEPSQADGRHFGVRGMRERAASIGAEFEIGPAPGGGTVVLLSLRPHRLRTRLRRWFARGSAILLRRCYPA
jgi:signal transduction histidine kinase